MKKPENYKERQGFLKRALPLFVVSGHFMAVSGMFDFDPVDSCFSLGSSAV